MERLTIKRNVPLPAKIGRGTGQILKTLCKLQVGDSFHVKGRTSQQISGMITYGKLKLGIDTTMRTGKSGVRVWRTK